MLTDIAFLLLPTAAVGVVLLFMGRRRQRCTLEKQPVKSKASGADKAWQRKAGKSLQSPQDPGMKPQRPQRIEPPVHAGGGEFTSSRQEAEKTEPPLT